MIDFEVIDNRTGGSPDCETIALTEEWAKHLIYCDIDSFAITEDGDLILFDDCNNVAYPPRDRFTVKFETESLRAEGRWELKYIVDVDWYSSVPAWHCTNCGWRVVDKGRKPNQPKFNYCPNCGARMEG